MIWKDKIVSSEYCSSGEIWSDNTLISCTVGDRFYKHLQRWIFTPLLFSSLTFYFFCPLFKKPKMTKAARDRALSQLKSSLLRRKQTTSTPLTNEDDTDIDTNVDLFDPPQASGSSVSIYKTQEIKVELGPYCFHDHRIVDGIVELSNKNAIYFLTRNIKENDNLTEMLLSWGRGM